MPCSATSEALMLRQCHGQRLSPATHQFLGPHVIEYPLGIFTVVPALHDGQEQLGCVVLIGDTKGGRNEEELLGAAGLNHG